jgi:hypothetical protein
MTTIEQYNQHAHHCPHCVPEVFVAATRTPTWSEAGHTRSLRMAARRRGFDRDTEEDVLGDSTAE